MRRLPFVFKWRAVQITGVPTSKVKIASSAANLLRRFTKYCGWIATLSGSATA